MGFRDDAEALRGRCDALRRELDTLKGDLAAAAQQRETLEERLGKLRWRQRFHRIMLAIFGAKRSK